MMHRDEAIYARADAQQAALAAAWGEGFRACMEAADYASGFEATVNPYDGTTWPEYKR